MNEFDSVSESEPELPSRLRTELLRISDPRIAVPPGMDDAILSDARSSFAGRQRKWRRIHRIVIGLAAAALVAIAARIFIPVWRPAPVTPRPQLAQVADINHDGRVDILDAYIVAHKIARHEPLPPAWDINGDGVVDQKDVDLIANLAVRARGEAPQ